MGDLESELPVEDTAIACVGAALLAAASLHEQRGGRPRRPVRLATGHVAAAVRSEAYLRRGGEAFGRASRHCPVSGGPPTAGSAPMPTISGTTTPCCLRSARPTNAAAVRARDQQHAVG